MRNLAILFTLTLTLTTAGCGTLKEKTGDYIAEAVADKVNREINTQLNQRGLTQEELRALADSNGDGSTDPGEVRDLVRDMAKDFALLEGKNLIDSQIKAYTEKLATHEELSETSKNFWIALLGAIGTIVSSYLGKQVYSAKQDGKRDKRIEVLEKLLQKDIDGDGSIGGVAAGEKPSAA